MESVILRSDIARLVLRYLQDQGLENVSLLFCKSSPHLKKELLAYQQGLQAYSFFPALEELICEYVKILQSVNQYLSTMPEKQVQLRNSLLSEKIKAIIQNNDAQNSSSATSESTVFKGKAIKRKRKPTHSSSESNTEIERTKRRRRDTQEYYFLSTHLNQRNSKSNIVESTGEESCESEDGGQNIVNHTVNETDISKLADMPKSESTPRNKFPKLKRIEKEISQVILENADFQKKLVNNINQALHTVDPKANENNKVVKTNLSQELENIQTMTPNQLDEMVQNILEATERDPAFDEIIEEVLGAPNTQNNAMDVSVEGQKSERLTGSADSLTTNSTNVPLEFVSSSRTIAPPRTPLIIRSAIESTSTTVDSDANTVTNNAFPLLGSNNSFGMYADPNFSISKLVVLNSGGSAQKQPHADQTAISIGNSTADHILSQLTNGTEGTAPSSSNADQILFDMSTAPITFPVLLTNDGYIAPIYTLSNSENQITHMEGNQSLPQTIVIPPTSTGQINITPIMQNLSSNKTQILPVKNQACTVDNDNVSNVQAITIDANPVEREATPSTTGVIPAKISKSLSTPRRRSTHVRTLTFSPASSSAPLAISGATPHSTRRNLPPSRVFDLPTTLDETVSAANSLKLNMSSTLKPTEKAIIRNVEILPQLTTLTSTVASNESSNSCSVPPLFVSEESTNQTVIKTNDKSMLAKSLSSTKCKKTPTMASITPNTVENDTPKRKQSRRTAVRRCKRQLSKSSNEGEIQVEAGTKKKVQSPVSNEEQSKNNELKAEKEHNKTEITLEDWKKLRSCNNNDLDVRLREINAKRVEVMPIVKREKRKSRAKRKDAELKEAIATGEPEPDASILMSDLNSGQQQHQQQFKTIANDSIYPIQIDSAKTKEQFSAPPPITNKSEEPSQADRCELFMKKATANIGYLLETPFKNTSVSCSGTDFVPPTPGVFLPTLDTPNSRSKQYDELRESASFLFGSLTKSELGTPLLNAITPGLRFTPHLARDTTPRSVATTEYSSGGSYYKPDESEDVDQNFDKMTHDSEEKQKFVDGSQQHRQKNTSLSRQTEQQENECEICVEIPVKTLKVEPIVLRRVKSFSQETATSGAGFTHTDVAVDPHYTLASGLPEICAEKEEADVHGMNQFVKVITTSSSSSSSSSRSSSSSCSSSSNSSSSDSEDKQTSSKNNDEVVKPITTLSLENLSDISSAEDEDWQKFDGEVSKPSILVDESSNLIDQHTGEIRYPVRSWLTPRKHDEHLAHTADPQVIKMTLKSTEKSSQQSELSLKRERVKTKLEQDVTAKVKTKVQRPTILNAPLTNQKKNQTKKKQENQQMSTVVENPMGENEKQVTVDVLTALQLSAKKPSQATASSVNISNATPTKLPPPGEVDDNAVSNIFTVKSNPSKATINLSTTSMKTLFPAIPGSPKPVFPSRGQGKCIQIEATSRIVSKSKQIVRTPLGFKGATGRNINLNAKKTPLIKLSPKPKNRITSSTATEKVRVSPRLQSNEKPKKNVDIKPLKTAAKVMSRKGTNKQQKDKSNAVAQNNSNPKRAKNKAAELNEPYKASPSTNSSRKLKSDMSQDLKLALDEINAMKSPNVKPSDEVLPNRIPAKVPAQSSSLAAMNDTSTKHEVEDDYVDCEDDDPLADCVRVTFDETDRSCHLVCVQDSMYAKNIEPDKITEHLRKFELHLAFDEHTRHTCKISETFAIFEQAPKLHPIRNIPKKRKIQSKVISPCSNNECFNDGNKYPIGFKKVMSKTSHKLEKHIETIQSHSNDLSADAKGTSQPSQKTEKLPMHLSDLTILSSATVPTNKIQIGDIESILSKIHDAET